MWYKFATDLNEVDNMAERVRNMNSYNGAEHLNMLFEERKIPKELLPQDVNEALEVLGERSRSYLSAHPQVYLYPSENQKVWKYLLFDPKDLRAMDNPDFHENLSTTVPASQNTLDDAIQWAHRKYPTALIDYYLTEEEMLRDA